METIPPRMHGMAGHVMVSVDDARMLLMLRVDSVRLLFIFLASQWHTEGGDYGVQTPLKFRSFDKAEPK
jgi:hypothetical protein